MRKRERGVEASAGLGDGDDGYRYAPPILRTRAPVSGAVSPLQNDLDARSPNTKFGESGVRPAAIWPLTVQPDGMA